MILFIIISVVFSVIYLTLDRNEYLSKENIDE